MAVNSRAKGKRAEREVEKIIGRSVSCTRPLDGREQDYGDIRTETYPALAVEVRHRKKIELPKWSRDHEAKVSCDEIPVVVWRTDGDTTWRASLPLDDLLYLVDYLVEAAWIE